MNYSEIKEYATKIDIKKLQNKDFKITPNVKESIEIYNSAVSNVQVDNADIAIIKLRKVVSLRPDFGEAATLLNMLLSYEKAKSLGDKVNHASTAPSHREPVLNPIINTKKKTLPEMLKINPRTLMKIIVASIFVILAIAIILIISSLVKAGKNNDSKVTTETDINALKAKVIQLTEQVDELTASLEDKNALINENTTDIVVLEDKVAEYSHLYSLYLAKSYYSDGKYTKAAEILLELEGVVFQDEDLDVYNQVYIGSMSESAKSVYNIGINLFNQQNYEGSLENLLMVEVYDSNFEEMAQVLYNLGKTYYELNEADIAIETYKRLELNYPEFPNKDQILYNTGKAYMKLGDNVKAKEMFNLILTNYPNSPLKGYATDKIKEINNS
ncbi:MAG: tetratricopeptide repeat protein [Clostridia bacterium]|nr:tetratricopeptide repeat protein [Clostridia bacterium]